MFKVFEENNIILSENEKEKLITFKNMLITWNNKFNLTSIKEDEEIIIKHFYDSIKGEKYFTKNSNCVEIGSGGGFPSIPLMIKRKDLRFTLIESVNKKCIFLNEVIKNLKLNAVVLNKRAEDIGKNSIYRESFDIITARAVAKLNTLSEYCIPLIKKGGLFISYKGDLDEEKESLNAINILGGKIVQKEEYSLPKDMGKRRLYVIEKIKNTPLKYPRGNGKERSNPL